MPERLTALQVFLSCFGISSFAGLAALLRSGKPLTWRSSIAAFLYSGMFGLVVGLLWYQYFGGKDNVYFLIGVSGLAGLGGMSLLDFAVQGIMKGFNIKISTEGQDEHVQPRDDDS